MAENEVPKQKVSRVKLLLAPDGQTVVPADEAPTHTSIRHTVLMDAGVPVSDADIERYNLGSYIEEREVQPVAGSGLVVPATPAQDIKMGVQPAAKDVRAKDEGGGAGGVTNAAGDSAKTTNAATSDTSKPSAATDKAKAKAQSDGKTAENEVKADAEKK